jgi:hypothetical protein
MNSLKIKQIAVTEKEEEDSMPQIYGVSENGNVYCYLWDSERQKKDIGWYKLDMTTEAKD